VDISSHDISGYRWRISTARLLRLGADVHQIIVSLITTGTTAAIAAAVRRFRNFGPRDKGKVEVEGEPLGEEDGPGS
jgi:hypothetical protein